ncbi:hypothetical protein BDV10DRAFT_157289 [Aspergillus recurvatus]
MQVNCALAAVYPTYLWLQGLSKAIPRRIFAYPPMRSAFGATRRPLNSCQHSMAVIPTTSSGYIPWSTEDDRVLRQLRAAKVSWKRISMVMDDRPVAELKQRWIDIRHSRHRNHEQYGLKEVEDDDWFLEEDYRKEERHVSFSPSLDEEDVSTGALPRTLREKRLTLIDR